jgi:endonuclease/exonuclease/phosphatase family metal-dependent hydrolase
MSRRLLPTLVTLACLLASRAARAEETAPLPIRVLSFNVWGVPHVTPERVERMREIATRIAALDPDLVALQEVWEPEDGERIGRVLEPAGLRHQHHFFDAEGRSGLWIGSRYPIEEVRFEPFRLGGRPSIVWHLDWMARKGVAMVRVTTPLGALEFANTHMQSTYTIGNYAFLQIAQAVQMADALGALGLGVRAFERDVVPLIAVGDLNATPESLPFQVLTVRAALQPAARDFGIDAVLSRSGKKVVLESLGVRRVLDTPVLLATGTRLELSDHPGLLAEFRLRPCDDCAPLRLPGAESWRAVATEVLRFLRADELRTTRAMQAERFWGVVLPAVAIALLWRARRRVGWRRRLVRVAAAAALLGLSGWLGYLGFDWGPWKMEVLAAERHAFERAR